MNNFRFASLFPTVIIICLIILTAETIRAEEYTIAPVGSWVTQVDLEVPQQLPEGTIQDGTYFILVDRQDHPKGESQASFSRYAQKIVSQQGAEDGSQITVSFEPSYQKLLLHKIVVHRAGRCIDKISQARIFILQREEDLEARIYDGRKTFNAVLNDIRSGDIVEYSYTIQGANPVFDGLFFEDIGVRWRVPVYRFHYRLRWPKSQALYVKPHGIEIQPEIRNAGSDKEYVFSLSDIPAIIPDSDLPSWYNPYPWIQISEFSKWQDVVDWGRNLYQTPADISDELKTKIEEFTASFADPTDRLLSAVRFVQDEIRYLGIEIGPNSHKPSDPSAVLSRRFGDCKDKTLLLSTILKKMGIEAYPALVNTYTQREIKGWQPSPQAFNHVIISVAVGGNNYWIDSTKTYQRGAIDKLSQPDYGYALVLKNSSSALVPMQTPALKLPEQEINETFDLKGGYAQPATLRIRTIYRGETADYMRRRFAAEGLRTKEKSYLNYYARNYPDIKIAKPMAVDDDSVNNLFRVTEEYVINSFWTSSEDSDQLEGSFYPQIIDDLIEQPTTRIRTMPLRISHPLFVRQKTDVLLPDHWDIDPLSNRIEDEAMAFTSSVAYRNRLLTLVYEFQTKKDHLQAIAVKEHIAKLKQIRNDLGYMISISKSAPVAQREASTHSINWTFLMLTLFVLALAVISAVRVYHYDPVEPIVKMSTRKDLQGIGGWLFLIAISMVIQPLRLAWQIATLWMAYPPQVWNTLTVPGSDSYHWLWQPVLMFELSVNISWFVFALLMLVLFFKKRQSFPNIYVIYLFTTLALSLMDYFFADGIPAAAEKTDIRYQKEIIRYGVYVCIWTFYLMKSRRVRNTFVKKAAKQNPVQRDMEPALTPRPEVVNSSWNPSA